jgi:hypothetical protein
MPDKHTDMLLCCLSCYGCCPQVVDFTLLSTFADLDESAVDSDPLLQLPCGHVFSTSTLDGWMQMAAAYEGTASGASCCC